MATKRKAWFRMSDALTKESLSNDELASIARIMGEMNTRWARDGLSAEESSQVNFRPGDLMAATGTASLSRSRRILKSLEPRLGWTVDKNGMDTLIKWPNYPIFQGMTAREQGDAERRKGPGKAPSAPAPATAPATATSNECKITKSNTKKDAVAPEKKSVKPKKSDETHAPENLTPEQWTRIDGWNGRRKPRPYTRDELEFSWDAVYSQSQAKSTYTALCWVAAFRNALRAGWPLEGYDAGALPGKMTITQKAKADIARRKLEKEQREQPSE